MCIDKRGELTSLSEVPDSNDFLELEQRVEEHLEQYVANAFAVTILPVYEKPFVKG